MAQTSLETNAGASYAALVTLSWSNLPNDENPSTTVKYTNWTEDIDIAGDASEVFLSVPDMEVELGEIHGGTEDKPGKLTISRQFHPFDRLRLGLAHPRVNILVEQCDPLDIAATRRPLFRGSLGRIRANPGGRASLVVSQLHGIKASLKQLKVGIPATATCQWAFGGAICGYDREATKLSGTVVSVGNPIRTSIQLSVGGGVTPNENYRRGTIRVGGMSLVIARSRDDGRFDLFRIPPPWLVGLDAEVLEGCDKQLSTCIAYGRESNFGGFGARIPFRQPIFEQ